MKDAGVRDRGTAERGSDPAPAPRRLGFPLAMQIVTLLVTGLVVAQLAAIGLALLLPPPPPPQYRMQDIAAALHGANVQVAGARPLVRSVKRQPPNVHSPGWLVSESSRADLARLLQADEADVRLLFYSPPPFAGAGGPVRPSGRSAGATAMAEASFALPLWARMDPQDGPGGMPGLGGPLGRPPARGPAGGAASSGAPSGVGARGAPAGPGPGGSAEPPGGGEYRSSDGIIRLPTAGAPDPANAPAPSPGPGRRPPSEPPSGGPEAGRPAPPRGPFPPSAPIPAGTLPTPLPDGGVIADPRPVAEAQPAPPPAPAAEARDTPAANLARRAPDPAKAAQPRAAGAMAGPAIRKDNAEGWPIGAESQDAAPLFGLAPGTFVQGDFVAAVRTAPGRWVTVQPRPQLFPAWERRVALWFLVSFSVVGPIGVQFARRLASPLVRFADAAERLGRDPSGAVIALDGPAEIGRAASAFNLMQARLKRFIDDRTAMVGAIGHDLRTPLARMRFRMERAPAELREGMIHDITQMEDMISSVLVFIRDASEPSVRERADFRSIVECVVDNAAIMGGDVSLEGGGPMSVDVDTLGIQRVMTNLVDNALKYGGRAQVILFLDGQDTVAEVTDAGAGLPLDELERVFLPFYRSDGARGLNKPGIGLGLAVSRSIARGHGGDVTLRNAQGGGVVAQLRLPVARQPDRTSRPPLVRAPGPALESDAA